MGSIPEIIEAKSVREVSIGILLSWAGAEFTSEGLDWTSLCLGFSLQPETTRIDRDIIKNIGEKRNLRMVIIIFEAAKINFINSNDKQNVNN